MLYLRKIDGHSMAPGLMPGDYILALKLPQFFYQPGQIVLVKHPQYGAIIKRIKAKQGSRITLIGDNPASVSSEQMGWLDQGLIQAKLIYQTR